MLGFLATVFWLVVFALPLALAARAIYKQEEDEELKVGRLVFSSIWFAFGTVTMPLAFWALGQWTDLLWFTQLGFSDRFWNVLISKIIMLMFGWLFATTFFEISLKSIAERMEQYLGKNWSWTNTGGVVLSILLGVPFGMYAMSFWNERLLFRNQVPFGKTDPIFGKDIAFYVFSLPFLEFAAFYGLLLILATMALVAIGYTLILGLVQSQMHNDYQVRQSTDYPQVRTDLTFSGVSHFSGVGIFLLVDLMFSTWLARYNIMYSNSGHVYGAGWQDLHVMLPAYWGLMIVLAISIVTLLISVFSKSHHVTRRTTVIGFGLTIGYFVVGLMIVPALIQHLYVSPNELVLETPYLKHNIEFTRDAFGLSNVTRSEFPVKDGLTKENLVNDAETIESARLWDWHVLIPVNNQKQAFRSYYAFRDTDVVRYDINGRKMQFMVGARELDINRLPENAHTWQNEHLVYTHGFGATANPVNAFTAEGSPDYWVKDIPVTTKHPELEIRQPRIYFGEATTNHIFVHTGLKEFDYPDGNANAWFSYDGPAGIPLNGTFKRFAFAWRFDGLRMLTSEELTSESRILFNRDIATRLQTVAPFIKWDADKYQVIADGQLWFMCDGYTESAQYPYSEPVGGRNYIRNSVKAVVNSYTGQVKIYIFDSNDPIIQTYAKIFPDIFQTAANMPESLRKHVRYPEHMLAVQGLAYANYHMDDSTVFYNREDAWQFAKQLSPTISEPEWVDPYYAVMALPGSHTREYVTILPFTPLATDPEHPRNNMVAWFAGRADAPHYGELILYTFPKDRQVNGPLQIGMRLNTDDTISKDLSLWNSARNGSKVILGDMRVLPLSDHRLLYVQPLYLQAEGGKMPELKRVVVSSGEDLVYEHNLSDALQRLAGFQQPVITTSTAATADGKSGLAQTVLDRLDHYLDLLSQGKFGQAGSELEALKEIRNNKK